MNPRSSRWLIGAGVITAAAAAVGIALTRGPRAISPCAKEKKQARQACYRKELRERLTLGGVAGAMDRLRALATTDKSVYRDGHVYAHGIGIDGYLISRNVPWAFDQCSTDFSSGCAHGVIQAFLETQPHVDSLTLNALCAPYRVAESARWKLFQCVHGIGHGLDMMYRGDLPSALDSCELLDEQWDRESCYGGVFMENIMGEIAPHHPASQLASSHEHHRGSWKRLDSTDLLYPCSIMEPRHLRSCYEIHTSAILKFTGNDVAKTAAVCNTAPEALRPICYLSLGRDLTSRALRDPGKTKRLCQQSSEPYRRWCYYGAVKALVDWAASAEAGMTFCRRLGDEPGALLCFQGLGEQIQALAAKATERERLCSTASRADAVEACRFGAGIRLTKPPNLES